MGSVGGGGLWVQAQSGTTLHTGHAMPLRCSTIPVGSSSLIQLLSLLASLVAVEIESLELATEINMNKNQSPSLRIQVPVF